MEVHESNTETDVLVNLADLGLVQYGDNSWNAKNYLIPVD